MVRSLRIAVVVLLCTMGCELGVRVGSPAACRSDFDCPLDAICTLGVCVGVAAPELVLDLALIPPNDSGYLKQQVTDIRVATGTSAPELVLAPTVVFSGRVLMEGVASETGLRARVEAQRPGAIAGTFLRASAVTVAEATSGRRQFRLQVVPGQYEIVVFSEEMGLPPYRLAGTLDLSTSREKDLVLPPASAFRRIQGKVVQSETDSTPIVGAQVQAFDAGGVAASTVGKTGSDGSFEVTVPPGDGTYAVRVSRGDPSPLVPTVERTGVDVRSSVVYLDPIAVGVYEAPRTFAGSVQGALAGGASVAVAGAQVSLIGSVGNGSWGEQITTDERGTFQVRVPPSTYAVEIRPPPGSEFGLHIGSIGFVNGVRGDWTLRRKARLSGQVTGPGGEPVAGVFVQASRRSGLGSTADRIQYTTGTSTDASGAYSILLDRGVYDLLFAPEGRPLARAEITSFALTSDDLRHDQRLPEAAVVAGVLRKQNGEPFPGVTVEAYLHPAAGAAAARLVGTGVTDSQGRYRVVIPAQP